jgi:hypothetical protein
LQILNVAVISSLPDDDEWPFLSGKMFALPAPWPHGTYRCQIIHFGMSLKDDPYDRGIWDVWLRKLENVIQQLYWFSVTAYIRTDFEPDRMLRWLPTDRAVELMVAEPHQSVNEWTRTTTSLNVGAA